MIPRHTPRAYGTSSTAHICTMDAQSTKVLEDFHDTPTCMSGEGSILDTGDPILNTSAAAPMAIVILYILTSCMLKKHESIAPYSRFDFTFITEF
ncbi:hypothetical protein CEXT_742071 [Caerostris extrusa]|uniref:Uncharacterized protein n=1 Tax=Caerostris extrusa TaxID=172846 RepID=A0AAV4SIC4_CAEEX|nr:hypothetical protein CEXT_742071 [Caerostris extrusa]